MQKDVLIRLIDENLSQRQIAAKFNRSQATVKYWLKKHGLKTKRGPRGLWLIPEAQSGFLCRVCNKPIPKKIRRRFRCGSCNTRVRRHRTKARAVALMGGACLDCGWSGPLAGFDFHHVHGKDFNIGMVANRAWHIIENELKKCVLLCRTCHSIRHSTHDDEGLIRELERMTNIRG